MDDPEGCSPTDSAKGSEAQLLQLIIAVKENGRNRDRNDRNHDGKEAECPSERAVCVEQLRNVGTDKHSYNKWRRVETKHNHPVSKRCSIRKEDVDHI